MNVIQKKEDHTTFVGSRFSRGRFASTDWTSSRGGQLHCLPGTAGRDEFEERNWLLLTVQAQFKLSRSQTPNEASSLVQHCHVGLNQLRINAHYIIGLIGRLLGRCLLGVNNDNAGASKHYDEQSDVIDKRIYESHVVRS